MSRVLARVRGLKDAVSKRARWLPRLLPFLRLLFTRSMGEQAHREHPVELPALTLTASPSQAERFSPSGLTVFTIIRNGIQNGYPFVESFGSWLGYCDRIFILDGQSTDGTTDVLAQLAAIDSRLQFATEPWPTKQGGGAAIADFTNRCLEHVRGSGEKLMYIQADEIYTPEQRTRMRDWKDGAVEFAGCTNFWNSFFRVLENDFPMRYLRLFPNSADVTSIGDGFTFEIGDTHVERIDDFILHYGWCFPVNVLNKHVSHASLYHDDFEYRMRGRLASLMLARGDHRAKLLDALEPGYRAIPFTDKHPNCVKHLLDMPRYQPHTGLQLLVDGVEW